MATVSEIILNGLKAKGIQVSPWKALPEKLGLKGKVSWDTLRRIIKDNYIRANEQTYEVIADALALDRLEVLQQLYFERMQPDIRERVKKKFGSLTRYPALTHMFYSRVRDFLEASEYVVEDTGVSGRFSLLLATDTQKLVPYCLLVGTFVGTATYQEIQDFQIQVSAFKHEHPETKIHSTVLIPSAEVEASGAKASRDSQIQCGTLQQFADKMMDFTRYLNQFVETYENDPISSFYESLTCQLRLEWQGKVRAAESCSGLIDRFLENTEVTVFALLGSHGMGKTESCRNYAYHLTKKFQENPYSTRIPLFIPLMRYRPRGWDAPMANLELLICNFLERECKIQHPSFKLFLDLCKMGKFLIILDGLDEMQKRYHKQTARECLQELSGLFFPGNKVLITARTELFDDLRSEFETFCELPQHVSLEVPAGIISHLNLLSEEQVERILSKRLPSSNIEVLEKLKSLKTVWELVKRPIFLDIVLQSLPNIVQDKKPISEIELLKCYIYQHFKREAQEKWRLLINETERRFFCQALADEMIISGQNYLHYSKLPDVVKRHFGLKDADRIEYFAHDVRLSSLLERDDEGNYSFSKSILMEFFFAESNAAAIVREETGKIGEVVLDQHLARLIALQLQANNWHTLIRWIEDSKKSSERKLYPERFLSGNAFAILYQTKADLSKIQLAGASIAYARLCHCDLSGIDFSHCDVSHVDFVETNLASSHFREAYVAGADFRGADNLLKEELTEAFYSEEAKNIDIHVGSKRKASLENRAPEGMVWVPPGTIRSHWHGDIEVYVDGFFIDKYAVTNAEFLNFVTIHKGWCKTTGISKYRIPYYLADWPSDYEFPKGAEDLPIVWVNWFAASSYAKENGKRLPTTAEWERVARFDHPESRFPWGDDWKKGRAHCEARSRGPIAVNEGLPQNTLGLFHILGNVHEWIRDAFTPSSETQHVSVKKPMSRINPEGDPSGGYRLFIGGSFASSVSDLNCMHLINCWLPPVNANPDCGFRCVMDFRG